LENEKKLILFTFFLLLTSAPIKVTAQVIDPQYVFVRKSPMHTVPDYSYNWNFDNPANINDRVALDVVNMVGSRGSEQRKIGIGVEINYNHTYDFNHVKQSLQNLLIVSQSTTLPVFINLSGYQWWGDVNYPTLFGRPDIWNWWGSSMSGYNSENKNNVEWTCWDSSCATKKAWRDWGGGEFEVRPSPNLASRAYIDACKARLSELVPIVVNWYKSLPSDKKWLFGGISNGTEIDIGGNYRVYRSNDTAQNNLSQSLPIGYAALKSSGIRSSGGPPTSAELDEIIKRFLNELDKFLYDQGIPRSKIYNHTLAADIIPGMLPSTPNFPTNNSAFMSYGAPGWTFYGSTADNAKNLPILKSSLDKYPGIGWASPEWLPTIKSYDGWITALNGSLNFRNNRFINIANWENGEVRGNPEALRAIKTVVSESPSCWVTTPQIENITISDNTVSLTWKKGNYDHAYFLISTAGDFGIDGVLSNKNIAWENITNITNWTRNLTSGKYYWQFLADGCVDAQFNFQNKTADGSFVVAAPTPTPSPTKTPTPTITSTPIPLKPGDLNSDTYVDIFDYNLLVANFGKTGTNIADINHDQVVDIFDYNVLVANFGK